MSGDEPHHILGGILMCNMGNNGFCGGNLCWIIILLILFCGCGQQGGCYAQRGGYGCECETNRCC